MGTIKEILEYVSKLFKWWIIVNPWEMGIRIRLGKHEKMLHAGLHFRVPFFDSIYVQTTRMRMVTLAPQTVSTMDGKTLTVVASVGYSISDLSVLYKTLAQPESTICNLVLSSISEYVYSHGILECRPELIEDKVIASLSASNYGIKYEQVKIVGFAVVKTFRFIQDSHWIPENLHLDNKS